jgi:hypothetical protein
MVQQNVLSTRICWWCVRVFKSRVYGSSVWCCVLLKSPAQFEWSEPDNYLEVKAEPGIACIITNYRNRFRCKPGAGRDRQHKIDLASRLGELQHSRSTNKVCLRCLFYRHMGYVDVIPEHIKSSSSFLMEWFEIRNIAVSSTL